MCLFAAIFLIDESFAYDGNTDISYTVASNTIHGVSETWREGGDDDHMYCSYWMWDDYGWYCYMWVLELNDPLVDAYSLSPSGGSTTRGSDVDDQHATVKYDFLPSVHGKWTAQGEH